MFDSSPPAPLAELLLAWYDRHSRDLPWRKKGGQRSDPYHVWLSEVMLQQTTVATVGPYFAKFLERWPTVRDLAAAELNDVLVAWAGLGYYARARNLHKCAQAVVALHDGVFPDTEEGLLALPGIGGYTAAAVAAIAFDRPAAVMDGNIERVVSRLFAHDEPLPAAKPALKALVAKITPNRRPGDFAQAMMDLGASLCSPRKPACGLCPWRPHCRAQALGIAETLPRKAPKAERPVRHAVAFWTVNEAGAALLRRRPEKGLLGSMMEIPSTEWRSEPWSFAEAKPFAPASADWRLLPDLVSHTFTHFHLQIAVAVGTTRDRRPTGEWVLPADFGGQALPTVMKKIVRHAMTGWK
jgi:A/G-specific adenine glycosylase